LASRKTGQIEGVPRSMTAFMKAFFHLPLIDRWHPWMKPQNTDMRWLPINQDIQMPDNSPMPLTLLDRLIEETSHRAVFDYCGCRKGFKCEHYPVEIGCLMMGDSAIEATKGSFREVGVEEAKEHARRAVDEGLVPIVGKARVDNFFFGVKDRHRLLTVCFCCECCCVTRFTALAPVRYLENTQPPLESLTMTINDNCKGCGKCAEHCYINAIRIVDTKAVRSDYCRWCGRCATVCPNDAIELRISDPDFVNKTLGRIRTYVKYD